MTRDSGPTSRNTRQQNALRSAIATASGPLSPLEVLEIARAAVPGLGIATVYRGIKQLLASGYLRTVSLPGESDRYEVAADAHHHHFQCNECRRVYDIDGCPVDLRGLIPRGFKVESHDLTLYGRCAACR